MGQTLTSYVAKLSGSPEMEPIEWKIYQDLRDYLQLQHPEVSQGTHQYFRKGKAYIDRLAKDIDPVSNQSDKIQELAKVLEHQVWLERIASTRMLEVTSGETVDLKSYFNNPETEMVVLAFGATWCPPCMDTFPKMQETAEKVPGIQIVWLSADPSTDGLLEALEEKTGIQDPTLPILFDPPVEGSRWPEAYTKFVTSAGKKGVPVYMCFKPNGEFIEAFQGMYVSDDPEKNNFTYTCEKSLLRAKASE